MVLATLRARMRPPRSMSDLSASAGKIEERISRASDALMQGDLCVTRMARSGATGVALEELRIARDAADALIAEIEARL